MNNIVITGATLLSVEEAKKVPEKLRKFNSWWWLRSPGCSTDYAACVNSHGYVGEGGEYVYYNDISVRPALQLNIESFDSISDGTKLRIGTYDFTVVCNGKYALCDTSIGKSVFYIRINRQVENANNYETSDVKKSVDDWYETEIKGQLIEIDPKIGKTKSIDIDKNYIMDIVAFQKHISEISHTEIDAICRNRAQGKEAVRKQIEYLLDEYF